MAPAVNSEAPSVLPHLDRYDHHVSVVRNRETHADRWREPSDNDALPANTRLFPLRLGGWALGFFVICLIVRVIK